MGPLSGTRVLDLSRVMAGPFCTQILADLGADVIKIEAPRRGDDTRSWGPPYATARDEPESTYFLAANRGKRSLAVDLSRPEGQGLILRLAAGSDVLVENFKRGGLERFGLDHKSLGLPRLVYCSITGFGQDGPRASEPGYDFMIQALSGLMSVTGAEDGPPTKVGIPAADLFTGLYAAVAILAALRHRDLTGQGQYIDLALYDCTLAALSNQASAFLGAGTVPGRLGNAHPSIVPYETFACADGALALAVGNDGQFERLCDVVELPALPMDRRFANNRARVEHRRELLSVLAPCFATRRVATWLSLLARAEIPAAPVRDVAEAFADPQTTARGMRLEVEGVAMVASPLKLSRTPVAVSRPPPQLGEHTNEVLRDLLRLDDDTLARLRNAGVIA